MYARLNVSRLMACALSTTILGVATLTAPAALAQADQSSSSSSPPAAEAAAPAEAQSYWTPEQLRNAKPLLPVPSKVGPEGLPEGSQLTQPQLTKPSAAAPAAAGKEGKGEGAQPSDRK